MVRPVNHAPPRDAGQVTSNQVHVPSMPCSAQHPLRSSHTLIPSDSWPPDAVHRSTEVTYAPVDNFMPHSSQTMLRPASRTSHSAGHGSTDAWRRRWRRLRLASHYHRDHLLPHSYCVSNLHRHPFIFITKGVTYGKFCALPML